MQQQHERKRMVEITQKQIDMTLEEFKTYVVPKGWEMLYVNGSIERTVGSVYGQCEHIKTFTLRVIIGKEYEI